MYKALAIEYHQSSLSNDPELTLVLKSYGKEKSLHCAFVLEIALTLDFMEIVKNKIYSQLNENMKISKYQRSMPFFGFLL